MIVILSYTIITEIDDVHDFLMDNDWDIVDGYLVRESSDKSIINKVKKIFNGLYIVQYMKRILSGNHLARKVLGIFRGNKLAIELEQFSKNYTSEMNENWLRTRNELEQLNDYLNQKNITLILVVIPAPVQLDSSIQKLVGLSNNMDLDEFDFRKANKLLEEFGEQNNVLMIDLTPTLEMKCDEYCDKYYFRMDGHWNKEGHKLAAEIMYNYINDLTENAKK